MFLTELTLVEDPEPGIWRFGAPPLVWQDPVFGRLQTKTGDKTDLASVPRVFRGIPFLDPNGISRRGAAMHDQLYGTDWGRRLGKAFADDFLYAALISDGASHWVAWTFWAAVHFFGASSWNSDGVRLAQPGKTQ